MKGYEKTYDDYVTGTFILYMYEYICTELQSETGGFKGFTVMKIYCEVVTL